MENVANLITSIGFPIVACLGMGWFVKYVFDNFFKQIMVSLNNNTTAIQKLTDMIAELRKEND